MAPGTIATLSSASRDSLVYRSCLTSLLASRDSVAAGAGVASAPSAAGAAVAGAAVAPPVLVLFNASPIASIIPLAKSPKILS